MHNEKTSQTSFLNYPFSLISLPTCFSPTLAFLCVSPHPPSLLFSTFPLPSSSLSPSYLPFVILLKPPHSLPSLSYTTGHCLRPTDFTSKYYPVKHTSPIVIPRSSPRLPCPSRSLSPHPILNSLPLSPIPLSLTPLSRSSSSCLHSAPFLSRPFRSVDLCYPPTRGKLERLALGKFQYLYFSVFSESQVHILYSFVHFLFSCPSLPLAIVSFPLPFSLIYVVSLSFPVAHSFHSLPRTPLTPPLVLSIRQLSPEPGECSGQYIIASDVRA